MQFNASAFQVPFSSSNTVALRTNNHWRICKSWTLLPCSQHFACLTFHFFLFPTNIWDGIIEYIVGWYTWIPSSRDSLQGCDHHFTHTKGLLKWLERHYQRRGRAICIGDDTPFPPAFFTLLNESQCVISIYFWNKQRHIILHAIIFCITEDRDTSMSESCFNLASYLCWQRRKSNFYFTG